MKIVHTPPRFYPYIGGVENQAYYLTRELVKLGHNVSVICSSEPGISNEEVIDGIKVVRCNYIFNVQLMKVSLKLPLRLLREKDYDVIHSYFPTPWCSDWSAISARNRRKPFILTYYNDILGKDIKYYYLSGVYNLTLLRFLLGRAHRIIISHPRYVEFSKCLKRYINKITIIPCGVDVNKFKPMKVRKEHENTVFFLSVLNKAHRYKGLDYLLKALTIVKKEISNVRLLVGGKGDLLKEYQNLANTLGLRGNVIFLGFIPESKIVEYYNKCDIFVLPSISIKEGFGVVLLEALACGRPVVTTNITGIAGDVKEWGAGKTVKIRDSYSLAKAIIELLNDKKLAKKMGKIGRLLVEEKYAWKKIARKVENLYESLLQQN